MCRKIKKAMRGTHDAAQHLQWACLYTVRELGFVMGKVSPCHFFQQGWQVCGPLRRDDFVLVCKAEFLKAIVSDMADQNMVKVIVAGPQALGLLRALNASICLTSKGVLYESDHRHAHQRRIEEPRLGRQQSIATLAMTGYRKARRKEGEYERENRVGEGTYPLGQ